MAMGRRPVRAAAAAPLRLPDGVAPGDLALVTVRAGLWVRDPAVARWVDQAAGGAAGGAQHALPDPDGAPTVIVGAPGEPMPLAEPLADLLAEMARAGHPEPIVVCHGDEPAAGPGLPRGLAARMGRPVLAQHGLLLAGPDGAARVTAVDTARGGWWHPLAERVVWPPVGAPRVVRWHPPVPGLHHLGDAHYELDGGWRLRVVPCGLLLSTDGRAGHAQWVADSAPHHPAWFDLILGAEPRLLPDSVLALAGRIADALPGPVRARLRVVLPAATEDWALRVRWVIPAPQWLLAPPEAEPAAAATADEEFSATGEERAYGQPAVDAWPEHELSMTAEPVFGDDDPARAVNVAAHRAVDDPADPLPAAKDTPDELGRRSAEANRPLPATVLAVSAQGRLGLMRPRAAVS